MTNPATLSDLKEKIEQFAIEINELHIAHVEDGDDLYKGNFHEAAKQIISLEVLSLLADQQRAMEAKIEGMKSSGGYRVDHQRYIRTQQPFFMEGYNQALSDVISIIKE